MIRNLIAGVLTSATLAGCTAGGDLSKPVALVKGPPVQSSSAGPYENALHCLAAIPETKSIRVAVGEILDETGKLNVAEGGTGAFVPKSATDMFYASLVDLGVKAVELTPEYQRTIDWLASKQVKGGIMTAQFIVLGSIPSLDFLPGSVAEFSVYGAGPKHRSYQAVGSMNVRLVTLPYNRTVGGVVVAESSVQKQFAAVENEFGVGTFVGTGAGLTFASFRIGASEREPMQYAVGYMADFAAADLVAKLLTQLSEEKRITDRRAAIAACRSLLKDPYHTAPRVTVASAT
jgi:hypothetical protein